MGPHAAAVAIGTRHVCRTPVRCRAQTQTRAQDYQWHTHATIRCSQTTPHALASSCRAAQPSLYEPCDGVRLVAVVVVVVDPQSAADGLCCCPGCCCCVHWSCASFGCKSELPSSLSQPRPADFLVGSYATHDYERAGPPEYEYQGSKKKRRRKSSPSFIDGDWWWCLFTMSILFR